MYCILSSTTEKNFLSDGNDSIAMKIIMDLLTKNSLQDNGYHHFTCIIFSVQTLTYY